MSVYRLKTQQTGQEESWSDDWEGLLSIWIVNERYSQKLNKFM